MGTFPSAMVLVLSLMPSSCLACWYYHLSCQTLGARVFPTGDVLHLQTGRLNNEGVRPLIRSSGINLKKQTSQTQLFGLSYRKTRTAYEGCKALCTQGLRFSTGNVRFDTTMILIRRQLEVCQFLPYDF